MITLRQKKVADFINAEPEEIVFVRNTTEAINLVSFSFPFKKGDRVSTTYMEHHSNLLPWLQLKEKGVNVDIVSVSDDYELDMDYYKKLPKNTRLVALTHASNVTGTINDIKEITRLAHEQGSLILIDAESEEIVFVRNTTEAINLVSFSFPFKNGDRVSTTYMEHHSNFLPWLQLKEKGVDVDIVSVSDKYELDMDYYKKLPKNTR